MVSQQKLIKQGINYTDKLFAEISKRLEQGVKQSDTLEAFLDATSEYTAKNPLISSGYDETMLRLILSETNNHKFSRPSQKELARVTIENYVGDLIVDVGEDVKESVREIVKDGYSNNLSQDEIATNISNRVSVIKNKRARAIARTEVARTATVSDYIINKEMGATHWYVECRNTACPICKNRWHKGWTEENDDTFTPSDTSAGGKGWIGDKIYPMGDTSMLPPVHPSCRCTVYFINENDKATKGVIEKNTQITPSNDSEVYKSENGTIVDNMGISRKGYDRIKDFSDAYGTSNTEHGLIMDMRTGEIYSPIFHGKQSEVQILEVSKTGENYVKSDNCVAIHNHPSKGYRIFSSNDLEITLKSERINHCIAVSDKEVWILKVDKNVPLDEIHKIVNKYEEITSKVKAELADDVVKRTDKIMEDYSDRDERLNALREFNKYMESREYMDFCQKKMNETVVNGMKEYEQYVSFKKVDTKDLRKVSKTLADTNPQNVKSLPKQEQVTKKTNPNLSQGQQEYINSLEKELDKLTKERDKLIKQNAPDRQIREVIGKRGMVDLKLDSAKRHISQGNYDKIPSLKKQDESSKQSIASKFISKVKEKGKKYLKWDDDTGMDYDEKKELNSAISKHYEKLQDKVDYTEEELHSLLDYQKNSSTSINKLLIFGDKYRETWDKFDKALNKGIDGKIQNIKNAINKSPGLSEDTILYTGQKLPENVLKGDEIGEFKHFASTSFKERIGRQFSQRENRYNIKILAPKGTKGIVYTEKWRGKMVNKGSGEGEFLLQAGTKFRVIKIDEKTKTATIELIV